ncbi:MAG: LysM peptidoglycan-binding domain-containing protein, partial [Acidimicrobiales bacterium]
RPRAPLSSVAAESGGALVVRCPVAQPRTRPAAVRRARVVRRRVVLALLTTGILVALALPWGGAGGHSLATPGPVLAGATVAHHQLYVVQPGDTLWSIAVRLDPSGDPRVIVAELQSETGSDTVRAGQRLLLP